jgi:hypothetical protein
MEMVKNSIKEKKKLKLIDSAFSYNCHKGEKEKYSVCIVIPFSNKSIGEKGSIEVCREDNEDWNYDELLITEKEYKKLLNKSNLLRAEMNI